MSTNRQKLFNVTEQYLQEQSENSDEANLLFKNAVLITSTQDGQKLSKQVFWRLSFLSLIVSDPNELLSIIGNVYADYLSFYHSHYNDLLHQMQLGGTTRHVPPKAFINLFTDLDNVITEINADFRENRI